MNTVNTNPGALTEQKLKELRKLMTATGIAFVQRGASDELHSYDVLVSVGGLLVNECAEIGRLLAQLQVLDELTRPVGSRGAVTHHDHSRT